MLKTVDGALPYGFIFGADLVDLILQIASCRLSDEMFFQGGSAGCGAVVGERAG
jgi:hypothetical protein